MTGLNLGHADLLSELRYCNNAEMSLQRSIASSHLETLIEQLTGVPKAQPDEDGDYYIPTQGSGFFARVEGDEPPVFRLFSVIAAEVDSCSELFEAINDINTHLSFLRAMYVRDQVLIEGDLLALTSTPQDFKEVCVRIAQASDHFSPTLLERFGGRPLFEETKSADYTEPAPHLPGYL
jgi:hypothetical protein